MRGRYMRVITFKIDEDLLERLDTYARLKGITRSEAIRRAIEKLLESEKDVSPKPKIIRIYS